MKTLTLFILVLLGALLLFPPPALAAEDSRFVRIDIDNIQAKTALSATMLANLNDVTQDTHLTLASGDTLQTSLLFPLVSPATWSVMVSGDDGKTQLAVEGELEVIDNSVKYRVLSARLESQVLELKADAEAISLVVGRVSGSLEAEVNFLVETEAVILVGIDTSADGQVNSDEVVSQEMKELSANLQTPVLESIPLTAAYEVKVISGDKVLASNLGSYDFAKGQNVKGTKFIDPKTVAQLSVTHRRVPFVAFIRLPNSIFQLPEGEVQSEAQSAESTIDVFKATESVVTLQPVKNAALEEANNSAKDTFEVISGFLNRYWPLLAIVGAVFVGMLLLIKLVFRFK